MDPREAIDRTIKTFNLKAADIAQASGITVQMLSRYRKKRQDMTSLKVFQVIRALPRDAQDFFWEISTDRSNDPDVLILDSAVDARTRELIARVAIASVSMSDDLENLPTTSSSKSSNLEEDITHNSEASFSIPTSVIEELVLKYLNEHGRSILREEVEHYLNERYKDLTSERADVAEQ